MLDVVATIDALVARPLETVILFDYDGSLAPIVARPDDAVALPAVVDVLGRLVSRFGRIGLVSGRPVGFLAQRVPVEGLVFGGLYGMELMIDGVRRVDPRVVPYAGAIAGAVEEADARLPGVLVERKAGVCVTLHWRTVPDRADEVLAVAADIARRHGLDEYRTRSAVELRPPVGIDKGTAVDTFIDGFAIGAFAGDDTGDLPAFYALAAAERAARIVRAVRIGVRSPEMPEVLPAAVDHLVDGPTGLVELLEGVLARLE